MKAVRKALTIIPGTVLVIAVIWVFAIVLRIQGIDPNDALGISFANMNESWRFLTSLLTAKSFPSLIVDTVLIAVFSVVVEYTIGTRKYLTHIVVFHLLVVVGGFILTNLLGFTHTAWGESLVDEPLLSPAA